MKPTVGIVMPGSTFQSMIDRFGDYDVWFRAVLEPAGARCDVYRMEQADLPALEDADGWVVTGARGTLTEDPDPATTALLAWIREAARVDAPLLGVCYGHEAIGRAMGAEVECHGGGWEMGTVEVSLTDAGRADPLFEGLPDRFLAQTTHEDHIPAAVSGMTVLADNGFAPVQALAVGSAVRGVQFHPEATEAISRDFVEHRLHLLPSPPEIREAPHAARVLANFVTAYVARAAMNGSRV